MNAAAQIFGAVHAALELELDWKLLGSAYCEGDASDFFDAALRERVLDTGLRIADDLSRRLAADGPRRSLYLGAAVAELAPLLVEHLVLGREVIWINLAGAELCEIARALEVVSAKLGVGLPRPRFEALEGVAAASCDHLWMVSVLTDPDACPALHDELYERVGSELATGRGSLSDDRRRADELCRSLLAKASSSCTLSTTDEELEVLRPLALQSGLQLEVPDTARQSAIVKDPVRICRLMRAPKLGGRESATVR